MSTDAYLAQLQQLLPPGQAWPRDTDATLTRLLSAMAEGLAGVDARADDLADEADPRSATELLKDWERMAGLPDACSAQVADTIGERQDVLTAKITRRGGQSRKYFVDLAAALGYAVTVREFTPFVVGSVTGDPCYSENWRFAWQVGAPSTTVRDFKAGQGAAGEPIRDWGNEILECAISATAPAHTNVIFAYGG